MVLVDSTVWIDLLRGRNTREVREVERLIDSGEDVCTCGVILTEVLQGIRLDAKYRRVLSRFDALLFLEMTRSTFLRAAQIFRMLRSRGVTVRKPIDCMIAAVAIENEAVLLHRDRDFVPIAAHCGLRVADATLPPDPARSA